LANLDAILMFKKKWRLILSQTDNAAAAGFVFVIGVVFRHRNACGKQLTFISSHRVWVGNKIDFAVGQRGGRQEGLPVTSRFELKIL
jgi:hypothetical protein